MKVKLLSHAGYQIEDKIGDILDAKNIQTNGYAEIYVKCSNTKIKYWFLFPPTAFELLEKELLTDSIVESVINQFKQRSEAGINKYGTTLDRNDLSTLEWIEHAKQEAMDFILYLEKLKHELK